MVATSSTRLAAAALLASVLGATGALAQTGAPPLPRMPLPPSASDPAPTDSGKKAQPKKAAPAKKKSSADEVRPGGSEPASRPTRAKSSGAKETFERPQRYVPEEFDRGSSEGSRAKPFVTESGRPGMGMRF